PAAAVAAEATIGGNAERCSLPGGRPSSVVREIPAVTRRCTTAAAPAEAIASATYGPRHPNARISTAISGAPTSSAIAHDISYAPIARPRAWNGYRWPIHAWPATVRLPTPTIRTA